MTIFCMGLAMFLCGWGAGIFCAAAAEIKAERQAIQDGYIKLNKEIYFIEKNRKIAQLPLF